MRLLFFFALLLPVPVFSQAPGIFVIDFVKVLDNRYAEALYYYENNWKLYRQKAKSLGYIKSFQLLQVKPDSTADFDLILMTEYPDSLSLHKTEERFIPIIRETRPDGPKLLNAVPAPGFRKNMFVKTAEVRFRSDL